MKDESSQKLFQKYGVVGAVCVALGTVIGGLVVGIICGRIIFEMGASEFVARVAGIGCGAGSLKLLLSWATRPAKNGEAS